MATPIDIMKSDYLTMEDITARLRAEGLEEYLKFKSNGEYEYFECENCDGPMLGHQVAKCRYNEGYEEKTVVRFKRWLDKIPELRRLLEARATYRAKRAAENQAEMMGRVIWDATEVRDSTQMTKEISVSEINGIIDSLINDSDEMIFEMDKLETATPRMGHTESTQTVEKLEESGKVNATEKLRPKNVKEEPKNSPKIGNIRDKPLAPSSTKETLTNCATEDSGRRINDWRSRPQSKEDRRSESMPGCFRTTSRGTCDSSQWGRRSSSRPTLRQDRGGSRIRSLSRGKSPTNGTKERERSAGKPNNDRVKKVESLEKEVKETKNRIERAPRIEETLKKATISAQYGEEGIFIDVKYVQKETKESMVRKSGAPVPVVSRNAGKPETETEKHIEKAPETCLRDKKSKRSSPSISSEPEGERERNMKVDVKEYPEEIALFETEVPIEEHKRMVLEAKDGEIERMKECEVFQRGDNEVQKETLKDKSEKIDRKTEASSRAEKAEVEIVKKQVVKHENCNTDLANRSSPLAHKKEDHKKELPKARVSNDSVLRTRERQVDKEIAKMATGHEMVGESTDTMKKSMNWDHGEEDFGNKRSLWHPKKTKHRDKWCSEGLRKKRLSDSGDVNKEGSKNNGRSAEDSKNDSLETTKTGKSTNVEETRSQTCSQIERTIKTKQQAETKLKEEKTTDGSKEEKTTNGLIPLRLRA